MIVFAHRHGFQCGVHVIGDRAINACIDGFVRAQREMPATLRHYLIHCDLITPADIRRMVKLGVGVSTQPILKWVFSDVHRSDASGSSDPSGNSRSVRCSMPGCR